MSKQPRVWVAELDIKTEGFSGSWLTVHRTRSKARRVIAGRAELYDVADLHARAAELDLVTDGSREITWVINRHTVD